MASRIISFRISEAEAEIAEKLVKEGQSVGDWARDRVLSVITDAEPEITADIKRQKKEVAAKSYIEDNTIKAEFMSRFIQNNGEFSRKAIQTFRAGVSAKNPGVQLTLVEAESFLMSLVNENRDDVRPNIEFTQKNQIALARTLIPKLNIIPSVAEDAAAFVSGSAFTKFYVDFTTEFNIDIHPYVLKKVLVEMAYEHNQIQNVR